MSWFSTIANGLVDAVLGQQIKLVKKVNFYKFLAHPGVHHAINVSICPSICLPICPEYQRI